MLQHFLFYKRQKAIFFLAIKTIPILSFFNFLIIFNKLFYQIFKADFPFFLLFLG